MQEMRHLRTRSLPPAFGWTTARSDEQRGWHAPTHKVILRLPDLVSERWLSGTSLQVEGYWGPSRRSCALTATSPFCATTARWPTGPSVLLRHGHGFEDLGDLVPEGTACSGGASRRGRGLTLVIGILRPVVQAMAELRPGQVHRQRARARAAETTPLCASWVGRAGCEVGDNSLG